MDECQTRLAEFKNEMKEVSELKKRMKELEENNYYLKVGLIVLGIGTILGFSGVVISNS